jgi:hypothetical protein
LPIATKDIVVKGADGGKDFTIRKGQVVQPDYKRNAKLINGVDIPTENKVMAIAAGDNGSTYYRPVEDVARAIVNTFSGQKGLNYKGNVVFNDIEKNNIKLFQDKTKELKNNQQELVNQLKIFKNLVLNNKKEELITKFEYYDDDQVLEDELKSLKELDSMRLFVELLFCFDSFLDSFFPTVALTVNHWFTLLLWPSTARLRSERGLSPSTIAGGFRTELGGVFSGMGG